MVLSFVSAVPAVCSEIGLEQALCELMGFIFIAERCTRWQLTLTADTGNGMQAWHVAHQSSDKEAVTCL